MTDPDQTEQRLLVLGVGEMGRPNLGSMTPSETVMVTPDGEQAVMHVSLRDEWSADDDPESEQAADSATPPPRRGPNRAQRRAMIRAAKQFRKQQ